MTQQHQGIPAIQAIHWAVQVQERRLLSSQAGRWIVMAAVMGRRLRVSGRSRRVMSQRGVWEGWGQVWMMSRRRHHIWRGCTARCEGGERVVCLHEALACIRD
jgi:hypothetical protein